MDIPRVITDSGLYRQIEAESELLNGVCSLRFVAGALAETVSRTVPSFTDHSTRHMDALWGVLDRILVESEVTALSAGEAFLLGCSFYLHDIGMAYAATEEGLRRIRSSQIYSGFMSAVPASLQGDPKFQAKAVAYASRKLHANAAIELATAPVPGTDIHLFDSRFLREAWAGTCGRIAASHHWSIEMVERELGSQGVVPLPDGRRGDPGYVAALLRLTDYAHINRDRAPTIDRAFRLQLDSESLIHWLAQENIDGPERDGADLVYRAASPISDVDAWWLYYEMIKGLDTEIRMVRRYLDRRAASHGRLSLLGVRGVTSPEEIAVFVPPAGFLPIEINLRTGSIERLVQLLAGESLYGPDPMAAVRELIQNARDAVMLKATIASTDFERATLSIPIRLALRTTSSIPLLEITDPGVGMTRKIITDYLISIASDYWTSLFNTDYPGAREKGFQPAGRFGIGFLSVFMLGEEVTVDSNREGGDRYRLHLRGVGRRGEIRTIPSPSGSGTAVRVKLRNSVVESLRPLGDLARIYAPMLPHTLEVDVDGQVTTIQKGWLHHLGADKFWKWTLKACDRLVRNRGNRNHDDADIELWGIRPGFQRRRLVRGERNRNWSKVWPEYRDEHIRLVASFEGLTLLCLRGLAIQPIITPGFVGVIDLESAAVDVSRRQAINADVSDVLARATEAIKPQLVVNLNALAEQGLLIDKLDFLAQCVSTYGRWTILEASVPWISLLKLPGEVELLSSAALLARLTKSSSLFLAYGTGPWTAMKRWVAFDHPPAKGEPAVVLDNVHEDQPPYQSGSEEKIGSLASLWPGCANVPLFGTVLRLAAEAWQVGGDDLTAQEGWHHVGNSVWGRLARP